MSDFDRTKPHGVWYPQANSASSKEDQLKEYRRTFSQEHAVRTDKSGDPAITWKPVPWDPRFPNIGQTKRCYSSYIDYHRCRKLRGPNYEPCEYFKNVYTGICPSVWYEAWDQERANNCFIGDLTINAPLSEIP